MFVVYVGIKEKLLRVIPTMAFQDIYLDIYSDILPNILSDIYSDMFESGRDNSDPGLAVRVRRGPLRSSACSWGPAEDEEDEEGEEE